jgi:hypothetical protein
MMNLPSDFVKAFNAANLLCFNFRNGQPRVLSCKFIFRPKAFILGRELAPAKIRKAFDSLLAFMSEHWKDRTHHLTDYFDVDNAEPTLLLSTLTQIYTAFPYIIAADLILYKHAFHDSYNPTRLFLFGADTTSCEDAYTYNFDALGSDRVFWLRFNTITSCKRIKSLPNGALQKALGDFSFVWQRAAANNKKFSRDTWASCYVLALDCSYVKTTFESFSRSDYDKCVLEVPESTPPQVVEVVTLSEEVPFIPNELTQSIFATKNYIRLEVLSRNNVQSLDADPPSFQFLFSTQAFMLAYQLFHYNKTLKTFFEILSKELWGVPDKNGYFYAIYNFKSLTEGAQLLASAYHILPMLQAADQIIMNATGELNMPTNLTVRFAPQGNEEAVCREYFAASMVRTFDSSYEAMTRYRLLELATSFSKAEKEMIQGTMASYFQIWRLAKENLYKHSGWSEQYCFIHTFPLDVTSAFGTFQEKDLPCNPTLATKENKEVVVPAVELPKGMKPALGFIKNKKYTVWKILPSDHPPDDTMFVIEGVTDAKDSEKFSVKKTSWYEIPREMCELNDFLARTPQLLEGVSRVVYQETYGGEILFDGTPKEATRQAPLSKDMSLDLMCNGNVLLLLKAPSVAASPSQEKESVSTLTPDPVPASEAREEISVVTVELQVPRAAPAKINWGSVWHK